MKIQKQPDYLIFADSAKKGENAEFPDISRGWGITIEQTASKPPMEWMNGAFNRVDKNMLYLLQQGVPEWNAQVIYPVNAIIKYNGVLYTAIVENENSIPTTSITKWKKSQAEVQDASTTQKGIVKLSSATDSKSETEAATPLAVKNTYDLATEAKKIAERKASYTTYGQVMLSSDIGRYDDAMAATISAVSRVNNQVVDFKNRFEPCAYESRVYSHDRKFYLFVCDDGAVATYNKNITKIVWGFNDTGTLFEGYVPVERILNIDQFVRDRGVPVGVPVPWPQITPPAGWFECNGAPIDKSKFPRLAAAYPSGFLPDLRGEFIRGWDNARGADPYRVMLSWQNHQLAAHRHVGGWGESLTSLNAENRQRAAPFGCTGEAGNWVGATGNDNDNPLFYTNDGTNGSRTNPKGTTSWFDLNPNGLVGNETHPRNVAFMFIVKAE